MKEKSKDEEREKSLEEENKKLEKEIDKLKKKVNIKLIKKGLDVLI